VLEPLVDEPEVLEPDVLEPLVDEPDVLEPEFANALSTPLAVIVLPVAVDWNVTLLYITVITPLLTVTVAVPELATYACPVEGDPITNIGFELAFKLTVEPEVGSDEKFART